MLTFFIISYPRANLQKNMKVLEGEASTVRDAMADLKTHLYAKFGEAINLESNQ